MDLSNMTTKELLELQKKIEAERTKRANALTKKSLQRERMNEIYQVIRESVKAKFPDADDEAISSFAYTHYDDFTKICDLAFCNLTRNERTGFNKMRVAFKFNGGYLYQSLSDDQIEKYRAMYNELVDVFMKYAKED